MHASQFHDVVAEAAVAEYQAAQNSWARSQFIEDMIALYPTSQLTEWALATPVSPANTLAASLLGDLAERAANIAEARSWFTKAAENGDFYAYASLASIEIGNGQIGAAIPLLQSAAELGDPETMVCLGAYYVEDGKPEFAKKWWRKAADADVSKAMVYLGLLAEELADLAEARKWLRKAAIAGNVLGMNLLGNMLFDAGEITEARQWYQRAANLGDLNALFNIEDIEESLRTEGVTQILSNQGTALDVAA